jgi:UDP-N-acetylmuramate dehydrogenase
MNALALPPDFETRVRRDEPMSRHTSWRIGGPADFYLEPRDREDLVHFLRMLDPVIPVLWIGLGSNLLVRDGGIRGVVIATHGIFDGLDRLNTTQVRVGAGVTCAKLAKQCVKWGLGAAEFFAGIPGTIGGALAMNAGAFGGETWRHVASVTTIDRHGVEHTRRPEEYDISYRHVAGPTGEWFLQAVLNFEQRDSVSQDDIRLLLNRRKETQPIGELSCGSVFTNPPGDHAARLIETAKLKGFRLGGARVSEKHANFVINDGTASARDVELLIDHVRSTVERMHGVRLNPEVRIVGESSR